jgi:hypothetical protein
VSSGPTLLEAGLRVGDRVRFHRADGKRWTEGTVKARERDGSIALHDTRGAARSIPIDRLEVRRVSRRGRSTWQSVVRLAEATEQLMLW